MLITGYVDREDYGMPQVIGWKQPESWKYLLGYSLTIPSKPPESTVTLVSTKVDKTELYGLGYFVGQLVTLSGEYINLESLGTVFNVEKIVLQPGQILPEPKETISILPSTGVEQETEITQAGLPSWSILLLLGAAIFMFFGKKRSK